MKKIIATNGAPAAIGPYSQAVELNGTLYVSGQLPVDPATGIMPQGIEAQTEQSLKNIGRSRNRRRAFRKCRICPVLYSG